MENDRKFRQVVVAGGAAETMTPTTGRARTKHEELTRRLRDLAALEPGDRFPRSRRCDAPVQVSDRTVLRSLDELSRAGWIVRRRGVAPSQRPQGPPPETVAAAEGRTIAALALTCTPSRFYQRCLDVLSVLAEQAGWSLVAGTPATRTATTTCCRSRRSTPAASSPCTTTFTPSLHPTPRARPPHGDRRLAARQREPGSSVCEVGDHEEVATWPRHSWSRATAASPTPLQRRPRIDAVEPLEGHLRAQEQAAREGLRTEWTLVEPERLQAGPPTRRWPDNLPPAGLPNRRHRLE